MEVDQTKTRIVFSYHLAACRPLHVGPPHKLAWISSQDGGLISQVRVSIKKEIGGSLTAIYNLASKSLSVISITFYLLRQSQSLAQDSRGGETDSAY